MGSERLCDLRVRVLFWFVFSLPVTSGCSGSFASKPTHPHHRSRVLDIQPSLNIRPLHWALPSLTLSSTSATPRSQLQPSRATARTAGRPTEATASPTARPWLLRLGRLKLEKLKSLDFRMTQRGSRSRRVVAHVGLCSVLQEPTHGLLEPMALQLHTPCSLHSSASQT